MSGKSMGKSVRRAVTAAVLVLLPLLLGCGGDQSGTRESDDRFSVAGRGLDQAVDSVRSARRRAAAPADGEQNSRTSLPAGVPSALDSGNAAYRAGNYHAALKQFESITRQHPDVRAGWFGVYMAQRALGNQAAADSAMRRAGMGSSEAARAHGTSGGDMSSSPHDFMSGAEADSAGG